MKETEVQVASCSHKTSMVNEDQLAENTTFVRYLVSDRRSPHDVANRHNSMIENTIQ